MYPSDPFYIVWLNNYSKWDTVAVTKSTRYVPPGARRCCGLCNSIKLLLLSPHYIAHPQKASTAEITLEIHAIMYSRYCISSPKLSIYTPRYFRHSMYSHINSFLQHSPSREIDSRFVTVSRLHDAHAITLFHVCDGALPLPDRRSLFVRYKSTRDAGPMKSTPGASHRKECSTLTRVSIYVTRDASMLLTAAGQ